MNTVRIQTGATEPLQLFAAKKDATALTGKTDLYVRVRRQSDGFFLDWADSTFKNSGWTTLNKLLAEIDATNFPGVYEVTGGWDTSTVTNKSLDDTYQVIPLQTPGTDASLPAPGEIKEGQFVDDIDAAVSSRATQAQIVSDATPFAGSSISAILADTAAIDLRLPADPADESVQLAQHAVTQTEIDSLRGAIIAADLSAVAGSTNTQIRTGATQANGFYDRMTVVVVNSAGVAARHINSYDLLNGAFNVDVLPFTPAVSDRVIVYNANAESLTGIAGAVWDELESSHLGAGTMGLLQSRLDVDVSTRAVAGDAMDLIAGAVDSGAIDATAVAEIADGVWDEPMVGHAGAGTSGEQLNRLDVAVSTRAAVGDAMDLVANALDAASIATSGVAEIADGIWDEPMAGHIGAGTSGEAQNNLDAAITSRAATGDAMSLTGPERVAMTNAIWNEAISGHLTAGTTGKALDDASSAITITPAAIADSVWDEALIGHTVVGSSGEAQNRLDANVSTRSIPGSPMDLITNAVDADAMAVSALAEIADSVWDEDVTTHAILNSTGAELSGKAIPGDAMDLIAGAVTATSLDATATNEIADQVWEEAISDHSGTVGSTAEALNNVTAPATPAVVAAAVWDEAMGGHVTVGTAGEQQNRLDVVLSTRSDHAASDVEALNAAAHGGGSHATATGFAVSADVVAAHATTDALVASEHANTDGLIATIPATTESLNAAAHGAGSHATATGFSTHTPANVADSVWDEAVSGHLGAGTTGKALDDAKATADPLAIADAVWDEDLSAHVTAGSMGEAQTGAASVAAQVAKIDGVATVDPSVAVTGSLIDRLFNKDNSKTYNQATDSLEAVRDRIG